MVTGKEEVQWTTPKDLGRYNNTIYAKDAAFDESKSEKKHARQVFKYEKFSGVQESLHTLILQAVEEPYLKALKEEYIGYSSRTPLEIVAYL